MGDEPAWVRIQKKTFTRWCNNYLQQRDIKVEDLATDLKSGVQLHTLLEILGNEEVIPKPNRRAKLKLQMVENLNSCLRYIKSKNIQLVNIGAEGSIMAEDDESAGARQALLDWCNSVLNPQGLHVKNFTSDWQDGRCFCGLVNAIEPNRIPLNTVPATDAENNMNKAFDAAEEEFGFPQVLDAIDVIEHPDDLSIMTYVSYFRAYMLANSSYGPNCYAEGPGLTEGTTFEKAEFKIITMNEENEPVTRGGARIATSLKDGTGAEVTKVIVTDNRDGTYSCYYVAERPGTFSLEISVQKLPIKSSPFSPVIKAGEPLPANCEAEGPGLTNAVAGEPAVFTVITKDVSGNKIPRGGANITGVLKDSRGDIPVTIVDNGDGTYSASYVPVTSGNSTLEVSVSTQHNGSGPIKNSPFTVAVNPSTPSGANSVADGPGLSKAVAGEENPFTVQTRDRFDNNCITGGAPVAGQLTNDATGEVVPVVVKDNGDGTYSCSYPDIKNAGTYTLQPTVAGEAIKESPFKVVVSPAGADAGAFTWDGLNLDADGNLVVVAGTTEKFSVVARDAFGNQQPTGGLNVAGTIADGPAAVSVDTADNSDGTYALSFTPEKAGKYSFTVTSEGTPIGGGKNPFGVLVVPAEAYGPTSPASGEGISSGVAGEPNPFTVQSRDRFENPLTQGGAALAATLTNTANPEVVVQGEVKDNGDGTYEVTYPQVSSAGTYTLLPTIAGEPIQGAPFTVSITESSADAANFVWEGLELDADGNKRVVAGTTESFTVIAQDKFGNRVTTGGLDVKGVVKGRAEVSVEVTDNQDGSYKLTYTPTIVDKYEFTVTLAGTPIGGGKNPFSVTVVPAAAYGPTSIASGDGLSEAVAGEDNSFYVGSHDKFENECVEGGAAVAATLTDAAGTVTNATVEDEGDGTYVASYASVTKAGSYSLLPTIDGEPIKGAPFTVTVHPSDADSNAFTWEGPALDTEGRNIVVAGVTETFTVTARDRFGNQLENGGLNVAAAVSEGPASFEVQTTDNGNGTYTLSYTPTKSGAYQFTTTLDGTPIGGHQNPFNVLVIPAEAYGPTSVASGSAITTAAVGSPNEFSLQTHDKFDNVVTVGGASIAATLKSDAGEEIKVEAVDNGDGSYTLSYPTVSKSGTYTLTPTVAGEPVKDAPFTITIAAGDFDPNNTGVEFPDPNQIGRRGPRVSVKDNQGNLRAGAGDVVEADLTPKIKIPNVRAVDNGDGTFDINYPPNLLPGEYKVNIRVNGRDAKPEPYRANLESSPLSEEHDKALDETLGGDATLFKRLLSHATDAERDSAIATLQRLSQK